MRGGVLLVLLAVVLGVLGWSGVEPHDRVTWWLEVAPGLIGLAILLGTWRRFPLTPLVYVLLAVHMVILFVGAKYTYALVPVGEWLREAYDLDRNHYDRLGHLAQGFVPAMVAREILVRLRVVATARWRFFLVVCIVGTITASYELI